MATGRLACGSHSLHCCTIPINSTEPLSPPSLRRDEGRRSLAAGILHGGVVWAITIYYSTKPRRVLYKTFSMLLRTLFIPFDAPPPSLLVARSLPHLACGMPCCSRVTGPCPHVRSLTAAAEFDCPSTSRSPASRLLPPALHLQRTCEASGPVMTGRVPGPARQDLWYT